MSNLSAIPYANFKRLCANLERTLNTKDTESTSISYEFITRSLFPDVYLAIEKQKVDFAMLKYAEGYKQGYKDCNDEKKQKTTKATKTKKGKK